MTGMTRYNQIRRHEIEWAIYARMKGIHARKRFQIKPVCLVESLYATRAATNEIHTAQAVLSNTKTAMLWRLRMEKLRSLLNIRLHVIAKDCWSSSLERSLRKAYRDPALAMTGMIY